jgi:hypothetical protein
MNEQKDNSLTKHALDPTDAGTRLSVEDGQSEAVSNPGADAEPVSGAETAQVENPHPVWKRERCVHCAAGVPTVANVSDQHYVAGARSMEERFPKCAAPTEAQRIAELEFLTEHQAANLRNYGALVFKIQFEVETEFPNERYSDFDVLDQGVWRLRERIRELRGEIEQHRRHRDELLKTNNPETEKRRAAEARACSRIQEEVRQPDALSAAGRELDALVAEKVMGWRCRGLHPIHECPVFATGRADTLAPHFSTDIAAAWQVVEKMGADGWNVSLYVHRGEHGGCGCSITCPYGPCEKHGNAVETWHGVEDVRGATVPLAICLAALKAVGA